MIQVINRALNILELIAKDPNKEYPLSEIANSLEIQYSTCANILKTLVSRGYVEQTKAKGGYKLGIMVYNLSNENKYYSNLIELTENLLIKLRNKVNETVILSVIKNYKRIILNEIRSTHEIQVRTIEESSIYTATTARVIMAHYSTKELKQIIDKIGLPTEEQWPGVSSEKILFSELEKIRKQNILITLNKNHVVGLATPVYKNNKVIASLGLYLPDIRFQKDEQEYLIEELLKYTDRINKLIN